MLVLLPLIVLNTVNTFLLLYPVILAATHGDMDAINAVLKHYEGYIIALSTRQLYDEKGQPHLCVDEGLRRRLETKLCRNTDL